MMNIYTAYRGSKVGTVVIGILGNGVVPRRRSDEGHELNKSIDLHGERTRVVLLLSLQFSFQTFCVLIVRVKDRLQILQEPYVSIVLLQLGCIWTMTSSVHLRLSASTSCV